MKRAVAATAITLSVIGGAAIVGRLDRTVPATTTAPITTHVQPATGVHAVPPPPIKEAERENAWTANANVNATAGVSPRPTIPTTNSAKAVSGAITATTTGKIGSPDSVARSTETATSSATDEPYRDSMLPGGSKWTLESTPVIAPLANSTAITASLMRATSVPIATSVNTTTADRCATITSNFRQDCATANRWLDDISSKYGAQMQRHYRWLSAATVSDWRVNGCSPSPCDANGTGRIQPPDYYGADGYDSPLGTCHSTTPFRRAGAGRCSQQSDELGCAGPGAMSTLGVLGGTKGDDGKVRGWVRWHGDWYVGTVEDATCTDACVVGFDHPCDLSDEREQPARRWDVAGKMFYSWWWGGDVNGEPPW